MLPLFIFIARLVLAAERLWALLAGPFVVLGLFALSAAPGLWRPLPLWLHLVFLLGIVLATGWSLRYTRLATLKWPTRAEGRHLLERRYKLPHRPLEHLSDAPAIPLSDNTAPLWQQSQARARKLAHHTGLVRLRSAFISADPWGLRYLVGFGLVLVLAGLPYAPANIFEAAWPSDKQAVLARLQGATFYITPPDYTQRPSFVYNGKKTTEAPQNSTLEARVYVRAPLGVNVTLNTPRGHSPMQLDSLSYSGHTTLKASGDISVTAGRTTLLKGHVTIIPDLAPTISWNGNLSQTPRGAVHIGFVAGDDYGVTGVDAEASLGAQTTTVNLAALAPQPGAVKSDGYADFTASPLAGLQVALRLVATDQAGQKGYSDVRNVRLPEHIFTHPVAKQLAALRKQLYDHPDQVMPVLQGLAAITRNPQAFGGDIRAYLSITMAGAALADSHKTDPAGGLMWDAAIRIDKGPLAARLEHVEEARKALEQALAKGAPPEQLQALYRQLAQAMHDLLRSATFGNKDMAKLTGTPSLTNKDLAAMMQKLDDLLKNGAYDQARDLLKQLEALMNHVSTGANPQMQAFKQAMGALGKLAADQNQLMRGEFAAANQSPLSQPGGRKGAGQHPGDKQGGKPQTGQGQGGGFGQGPGGFAAGNQSQAPAMSPLQQSLQQGISNRAGDLAGQLQGMGFNADSLKKAQSLMGLASEIGTKPGLATTTQGLQASAAKLLARMQSELMAQLAQAMKMGGMAGYTRGPDGQLHRLDEDVPLPTESPDALSKRIRKTLIDRADDIDRPADEQDYLRRLLKPF